MKLYLDADIWSAMGDLLRIAGHDVLTSRDVGRLRAHDEEQIAFAAEAGRILITHNRKDFLLLQRAWRL